MGLEPPNSPYYDVGDHSNRYFISPNDAALGFDIQYNKPFTQPVYDVMNGILSSKGSPDAQYSFNSWGCEYLRQNIGKWRNN
jgi:hypothetical protein